MEATEKQLAQATKVLNTISAMLDDNDVRYDRDDEDHIIRFGFKGDDFPVDMIFKIVPEKELVAVLSPLAFTIPENGRVDVVIAMNALNEACYDGMWCLNLSSGKASFRMTNSYRDSILGKECFKELMGITLSVTDAYADKFFMLGKGSMTVQQFYDSVFGGN